MANIPGIHVHRATTSASREWAKKALCVVQMDHTDALQAAPDNATRVYRKFYGNQPWTSNPHQQGKNIANDVIGSLGGYNHSKLYITGYNEPPQKAGANLEASLLFHKGFVEVAHGRGYKVAGYSFATGNPEVSEAQYLANNNWGDVDAISWHCYWGAQGFTQWHALRYRYILSQITGRKPPSIITETGRVDVEGGKNGWKLSGLSRQQYWNELVSYAGQVGDTLGCAVFTGSTDSSWANFNVDELVGCLSGNCGSGGTSGGGSGSGGSGGGGNGSSGAGSSQLQWLKDHPLESAAILFVGLIILSD